MHKHFRQLLIQTALAIIGLYVILPIWGILRLAFDGTLQGRATEFRLWPSQVVVEPLLKTWNAAYLDIPFLGLLKNSLIVSLGAGLIAVGMGISLAYAFARFRFPARQTGLFILLLTAVLPAIAFATPLYIILSTLKLRTTLFGLTIVYAAFAMPFCIWNMRSTFQAVPKELEEAAFLDGASDLTSFIFVTFPLALPSIAISALIAFLIAYSEFAIGWLFVEKSDTVTLAMSIYAVLTAGSFQPWSQIGSLMLLMCIPVVIIFLIFQNTLLEQMMFGGLNE